jgi:hypothetical protein
MKIAVMQPYLFPYLGYFQLMHAVDRFVVLDDVTYIKGGWINRNRILVNRRAHLFTVPLAGTSSNKRIHDLVIAERQGWRDKLLKTIAQAYRRAACFEAVYPLIERVIRHPNKSLADFVVNSLILLHRHLGLKTELVTTSRHYRNRDLKGQDRILDICRRENAREYINAPGGRELYTPAGFAAAGVALRFLQPRPLRYRQFDDEFVPDLSIIDALMFNPPDRMRRYLDEYDLTAAGAG